MSSKTFLEFFAGVGLVRLGLEQAGWRCVFANDHDPKKQAIYEAHFSAADFLPGDIAALKPAQIPDATLATASFPCTDLSLAGMRKGLKGRESGAFFAFASLIKKMGKRKPALILLENVPGLLTSHGGEDLRVTLKTLNELGYRADIFTLDARLFVPQSRRRLFILGMKNQAGPGRMEIFENRDHGLKTASLERAVERLGNDIKWRFAQIPAPPPESSLELKDIVEQVPDKVWWNGEKIEKLLGQIKPSHLRLVEEMKSGPGPSYRAAYRRVRKGEVMVEVRRDSISGCLRPPRGGSSRQILIEAGGGEVRARFLTAREYARLQGAPDEFPIPRRESEGLFGFGDAVCVPAVAWIAENVLNPLVIGI